MGSMWAGDPALFMRARAAMLAGLALGLAAMPAHAQVEVPQLLGPTPTPTATTTPPESSPTPPPTPTAEPKPTPKPALPDGRTLESALRRAYLAGHLSRDAYAGKRSVVERARRAVRKLRGARRAELAAVLSRADAIAAEGRLAPSRLEQVVLTLRRNIEVFANGRFPGPSERMTFGEDPLVFQYFSGRGMQLHPLGSFGAANALAVPCLKERNRQDRIRSNRADRKGLAKRVGFHRKARRAVKEPRKRPRSRCSFTKLRRTLDRLVAVSANRGGFAAWEYAFTFGYGGPFWISAMTQATAVQALARGGLALGEPRYLELAEHALGSFEAAPPTGVALSGARYAMYSQQPSLEVFNGFLQAVIGLHDHHELTGSRRSGRLFRQAEPVVRSWIEDVDTGAWTLYARGGREATLHYHRLARTFISRLCQRTGKRAYCNARGRFAFYETEPPRMRLLAPDEARALEPVSVQFTLSKISTVTMTARDKRGVSTRRVVRLPRGTHRLAWTPVRRGKTRLTLAATGPAGNRGTVFRKLRVKISYAEIKRRREAKRKAEERKRRAERRARREAKRLGAERKRERREERSEKAAPVAPDGTETPEASPEASPNTAS